MLQSLHIRDFALIKDLEVHFGSGLNIITGETGAGKSILVGGMKLIFGERAQTDLIRRGATKAVIEGIFILAPDSPVRAILDEQGFDVSDTLILRREVRSGQSRAFVNDTPANVSQVRQIAVELVDLHGQHEHQSLLQPDRHGRILDAVGGHEALLKEYQASFERMGKLRDEHARLTARKSELMERRELLRFQADEIDTVAPEEDEDGRLELERARLEHAEELFERTADLYEKLYEGDRAALAVLKDAERELSRLAGIDNTFEEMVRELEGAAISIREIARNLIDYHSRVEFNPERVEDVRSRLGELDRLARKYGGSLAAVLERRQTIGAELAVADGFEGELARIESEIQAAEKQLSEQAESLSLARADAARLLADTTMTQLAALGMPDARVQVELSRAEAADGWIRDFTRVGDDPDGKPVRWKAWSTGVDRIRFLFSANRGESLRSLETVASGGEVSRIMLAFKSALAARADVPVLIFDEIDSGISGRVAFQVSEKLASLAADRQLLVITHLPQVAARAQNHYKVSKIVDNERTTTTIARLEKDDRKEEVARLLSGATITDAALRSAEELIGA